MIRSKFLTHWTGKNIEPDIKNLNEESRKKYLERLCSVLIDGFWMNVPKNEEGYGERVYGSHPKQGEVSTLHIRAPMVCFTELRLSQSQEHYTRYGLLGIVVDREFVLERHGAPVFYVPSNNNESIVWNLISMIGWIYKQTQSGDEKAKEEAGILFKNSHVPIAYLKAMSSENSNDFINLEENEWRIVHTYKCENLGLIEATGKDYPNYKIPLSPSDIKMIVLPDSEFRDMIVHDSRIEQWFDKKFPPLLTIEEIGEL